MLAEVSGGAVSAAEAEAAAGSVDEEVATVRVVVGGSASAPPDVAVGAADAAVCVVHFATLFVMVCVVQVWQLLSRFLIINHRMVVSNSLLN